MVDICGLSYEVTYPGDGRARAMMVQVVLSSPLLIAAVLSGVLVGPSTVITCAHTFANGAFETNYDY